MSYKTILVNVDVEGSTVPVVKAAIELAQRFGAKLIGFCAASVSTPATGPEGAALAAEMWQQARDDERRFKDLRREFEAQVGGVVEAEWRDAAENPTFALTRLSRMADLIVTEASHGAATRVLSAPIRSRKPRSPDRASSLRRGNGAISTGKENPRCLERYQGGAPRDPRCDPVPSARRRSHRRNNRSLRRSASA